jgi:hypothetical protein
MKKINEIKSLRCWSEQCNGTVTAHQIKQVIDEPFLDENGLPFDLKIICQTCQHVVGTWFNFMP